MARPVDAEALEKKISEWLGQPGNGDYYSGYDAALCAVQDLIADTPTITPPNEPLTCEGCAEIGKWENEYEYGYPSPCTRCKRRAWDNYRRPPEGEEDT